MTVALKRRGSIFSLLISLFKFSQSEIRLSWGLVKNVSQDKEKCTFVGWCLCFGFAVPGKWALSSILTVVTSDDLIKNIWVHETKNTWTTVGRLENYKPRWMGNTPTTKIKCHLLPLWNCYIQSWRIAVHLAAGCLGDSVTRKWKYYRHCQCYMLSIPVCCDFSANTFDWLHKLSLLPWMDWNFDLKPGNKILITGFLALN